MSDPQAEIARLRAGEDPTETPEGQWPTPGAWIYRFNEATAEERLTLAAAVLDDAATASDCWLMAHKRRIEHAETSAREARAKLEDMRREFLRACAVAEDSGNPGYVMASLELIAAMAREVPAG